MKSFRRIVAWILTFAIIYTFVPQFGTGAFADTAVDLSVDGYDSGALALSWSNMLLGDTPKSIKITYHDPYFSDPVTGNEKTVWVDTKSGNPGNTASVSGLRNDVVYDICIEMYDNTNHTDGVGKLGEGFVYFLPGVTFTSSRVERSDMIYEDIAGGGRESGSKPMINLKWAVPRVWSNSLAKFIRADSDDAATEMTARINSVYSRITSPIRPEFKINVSADPTNMNALASISLEKWGSEQYTASVTNKGCPEITTSVDGADAAGFMDFDLSGRKDENVTLTSADAAHNILPDNDILPGTVYYMDIKLSFKYSELDYANVISMDSPTRLAGSYTYTPIRFVLTRDDADNIYVKIYKLNSGSLSLPRMYYEVQTSDDPLAPDKSWKVRKTLDDTYFQGTAAITNITGIYPQNLVYYRIVVKSDSADDRIESLKMPYILSKDTSRLPVPSDVTVIDRTLVGDPDLDAGGERPDKSTDITISWSKPANWEEIKARIAANTDHSKDVYFCITLNTNQTEIDSQPPYPSLTADGVTYGEYKIKYRLVKYFNARLLFEEMGKADPAFRENGNRLEYTLKGYDLFKADEIDSFGNLVSPAPAIPNSDSYPGFLLPNKVYYLQMYTTLGEPVTPDDISQMSLVSSFTTLPGIEKDVPLPQKPEAAADVDITLDPVTGQVASMSDYVKVKFDNVDSDIDWDSYTLAHTPNDAVYYDLYMSTRTGSSSFVYIGSTEPARNIFGADFEKDSSGSYVFAVRNFTDTANPDGSPNPYNVFGSDLRPNTAYYFIIKTRLVLDKPIYPGNNVITSNATSILTATTPTGPVNPPDETGRKPLAPVDFAVAKQDGNPVLTGTDALFDWTKCDENVRYSIVCTSERLALDAELSEYKDDPLYSSFMDAYGKRGFTIKTLADNTKVLSLNPSTDIKASGAFQFDKNKNKYSFFVDNWLFPNRLYYFSIRTEIWAKDKTGNDVMKNASEWISIPVVTSLIDAPSNIQSVNSFELGFYWTDSSASKAEDYTIYLRGPKDKDYKTVLRSQCAITKRGTTAYARIFSLDAETPYDVKVYRGGSQSGTLVFSRDSMLTRGSLHEVEVKWYGLPGYRYELEIKAADAADYTLLADYDMEQYTNADGELLPYYAEADAASMNGRYCYHARIKTAEAELPDGSKQHKPLSSNTKYYIRVRSVKVDFTDTTLKAYSKFIGPAETRTSFSQDDYDKNEDEENKKAVYLDKISSLEEGLFWKVDMSVGDTNKVLLKGDRVANIMKNSRESLLTIDISGIKAGAGIDEIFIPIDVIRQMNAYSRSLAVKMQGTELTLRPRTLDMNNTSEIASLKNEPDIYVKLRVARTNNIYKGFPAGASLASSIHDIRVQAYGSRSTDKQLEEQIHDKLYNTDTGLVSSKLKRLMSTGYWSSNNAGDLDRYMSDIVSELESELSGYIGTALGAALKSQKDIAAFSDLMLVKMEYSGDAGLRYPYACYNGTALWQKIENSVADRSSIKYNVLKSGKYAVLLMKTMAEDVPDDYWAKDEIACFTSRYELADIFQSSSLEPDTTITNRELLLMYARVSGKETEMSGMDDRQKLKYLGLDKVMGMGSLMKESSRQELAAVTMEIYTNWLGTSADMLTPSKNIYINDDEDIASKYYNQVIMCLDTGILTLNNGYFGADDTVTRAELISAFTRALKLTGDIES